MSKPLASCLWSACLAMLVLPAAAQQDQPPKVTVAAAYTQEITDTLSLIGRGEAIETVDIVARVPGFLQEVAVPGGAQIDAGTLMFRIEPDSYEATLAQRQAEVTSAEAELDLANIELDRKRQLVDRQASPQSELDIALANAKASEAKVTSAQAALRQAELDLGYTEIMAPFTGRIGRVQVSEGALVGPETGALATLVQIAPIYVAFSIDEKLLVEIIGAMEASETKQFATDAIAVRVILPDGSELDEVGTIAFGDNRIDPATGTLTVRAKFDNARGLIVDGAFLNVEIAQAQPVEALLVPQAAVQRDQRGAFVLVVGSQQTVEQRYVTLGQETGTAVVVEDGLQPGEAVIVEGLQRVRPGAPVDAILAGSPDLDSAAPGGTAAENGADTAPTPED